MPLYNNWLTRIWNGYAEDVGRSLIHLGALGWLLSSTAQATMIATNKNIDKKEKQFLLPQEISDGVINVTLYYTICQAIKKGTDALLEKGVFLTKKSFDTIMKIKPCANSCSDYIKAMSEFFVNSGLIKKKKNVGNLTNFYNGSIELLSKPLKTQEKIIARNPILQSTFLPLIEQNKTKPVKKLLNGALKEYSAYKNGVGIMSAVGASVLACSIITPLTRNYIANVYQKKRLEKEKIAINNNKTNKIYQNHLPVSDTYKLFRF